ncbi:MAG TPA: hypothetical protein VKN18_20970 [Blastocatellia bacterium]|nr:hypothetical protein [Blastocatellia bacterium]
MRNAIGWVAVMMVVLLLALGISIAADDKAAQKTKKKSEADKSTENKPAQTDVITSIPFAETNGKKPFNASGVAEIGDGQFLFCDNKIRNALIEFRLDQQGKMSGQFIRRPLSGVDPSAIDDLEGMTIVERNSDRFVVATSSFERNHTQKGKKMVPAEGYAGGLLRISPGTEKTLKAENIPGFREWLISKYPELKASADLVPDDGGLNIEGLAWDPNRGALLFGLRTPHINNKPAILPVRLKGEGGQWRLEDFEALPAITLQVQSSGSQGIRSLAYAPKLKAFVISLGKATSTVKAPFSIVLWDGGDQGTVRTLENLRFARGVKIEGLAGATIGGKRSLLLIDDAGGYSVIQEDDPRLR